MNKENAADSVDALLREITDHVANSVAHLKLIKSTSLRKLPEGKVKHLLTGLYSNTNLSMRLMGMVLNAMHTQERSACIISYEILRSLISQDKNFRKRKTLSGSDCSDFIIDCEKFLTRISEPVDNKKLPTAFSVRLNSLRSILFPLRSELQFHEQELECLDLIASYTEKYMKTSTKTSIGEERGGKDRGDENPPSLNPQHQESVDLQSRCFQEVTTLEEPTGSRDLISILESGLNQKSCIEKLLMVYKAGLIPLTDKQAKILGEELPYLEKSAMNVLKGNKLEMLDSLWRRHGDIVLKSLEPKSISQIPQEPLEHYDYNGAVAALWTVASELQSREEEEVIEAFTTRHGSEMLAKALAKITIQEVIDDAVVVSS